MLSAAVLATRPDFTISVVICHEDHRGWSEAEVRATYGVVLVRRGRFHRRVAGVAADVDPTLGCLSVPGAEEHFAHPAGGDVCTWVSLTPRLWRLLAGERTRPAMSSVYVDARLDVAHRRVLAAARSGDVDYAVTEELVGLLGVTLGQAAAGPAPPSPTSAGDRALVSSARAAIAEDHPAATGLLPLADLLDVSPYRLSRVFPRELGVSLTRYRNRVRVGHALDRLEGGEQNLGVLAADLGFADQAHLCRTVRDHVGHTPAALRRLLS